MLVYRLLADELLWSIFFSLLNCILRNGFKLHKKVILQHMLLINIPSFTEDTNHPQMIVDKSQRLTCVIFLHERNSSGYKQHWLTTLLCPFCFFFSSRPDLRAYRSASTVHGHWNAWVIENKPDATKDINRQHFVSARSLSLCSFPSVLFSRNTTECYFASVFLLLHESLSLSHHPWLHSIYPLGPIDRLQQPFNEISSVLLEKRNVVQSNR